MLTASRGDIGGRGQRASPLGRRGRTTGRPWVPAVCRLRLALSLAALEELPSIDPVPTCPSCGGTRFRRVSIFDRPTSTSGRSRRASSPTRLGSRRRAQPPPSPPAPPRVRRAGEAPTLHRLAEGWTRIGRSGSADLRLDDPTVSRRHALIVLTDERRPPRARRPQPERPVRQRRAGRMDAAQRRRRARDRPLPRLRASRHSLAGSDPSHRLPSPRRLATRPRRRQARRPELAAAHQHQLELLAVAELPARPGGLAVHDPRRLPRTAAAGIPGPGVGDLRRVAADGTLRSPSRSSRPGAARSVDRR